MREGRKGGEQSAPADWRSLQSLGVDGEQLFLLRGTRAGAFRHQLPCPWLRSARGGTLEASGSWKVEPVLDVRPKGLRASAKQLWLSICGLLVNSIKLNYVFSDILNGNCLFWRFFFFFFTLRCFSAAVCMHVGEGH